MMKVWMQIQDEMSSSDSENDSNTGTGSEDKKTRGANN